MNNPWKFRIVELTYKDEPNVFVLESDRGTGTQWFSIYRNSDLQAVRDVKRERETGIKKIPVSVNVIE